MTDRSDDHGFGTDLGARCRTADPAPPTPLVRQLFAGAVDVEHAAVCARAQTHSGAVGRLFHRARPVRPGQPWLTR